MMRRWSRGTFLALGGIPLLWLGVFFILPLVFIFTLSFSEKIGVIEHRLVWTFANYARAFEPIYLSIFAKSFLIAGVATVICLLMAYPLALVIAFSPRRFKIPLLVAVTLPFWINVLVRTYALIAVFRTQGYFNFMVEWFWNIGQFVLSIIGIDINPYQPLSLLYSNAAVVLGIVYVFTPFMILPLYAVMDRFNRHYLEASLDLGASQWQAIRTILIPLTFPGIIAGIVIVFIPALGTFFIADLLGGTNSQLLGNVIERQFLGANNWPFGAALSFILMYLTLAVVIMGSMYYRYKDYV